LWLLGRTCRLGPQQRIFAGHASAARIFAAALVRSVKRPGCCVTPHAIGTPASHGITNLVRHRVQHIFPAFEMRPTALSAHGTPGQKVQNSPSLNVTQNRFKSFDIKDMWITTNQK